MDWNWIQFAQNFEFIWPWMLALLPMPWVIRMLLAPIAKSISPLLAPTIAQRVGTALPKEHLLEPSYPKSRIPALFILLWLLLVLAATRPVWYLSPTPFQISGKEMMLAVDLSGSMQKADMVLNGQDVNRLVAVKSVVGDFIAQRDGDRMGLLVFGTQAFLLSPMTYDLNTLKTLLNESQIGMAGNNTAMGDAIGLTMKHLQKQNLPHAVLILLTDGSNTSGVDPLEAAAKAKEMGLKIYTVGVGQVTGSGSRSEMDIATLIEVAKITEGRFFHANNTDELKQIYQEIDQLESVDHDVFSYRLRTELYAWPLGAAMILSLFLAWRHLRRHGSQ